MISIDLLSSISPFPFISEQKGLSDGYLIKQPSYCKEHCKSRSCLLGDVYQKHQICTKFGFSYFLVKHEDQKIVFNGLYISSLNKSITGKKRSIAEDQKVNESDIIKFISNIEEIVLNVENEIKKKSIDNVSFIHEVKNTIGITQKICENIISNAPGYNFDDKLNGIDSQTRNLYLSINLLVDQLSLSDIIMNPERVKYGRLRKTSIYRFFDKIARLYEFRATARGIHIRFGGRSVKEVMLYESIQFLPLILFDNALKYSFNNKDIIVQVNDVESTKEICVEFSNYGFVVDEDEIDKIFNSKFRGRNASEMSQQGNGIGLYIAQEIALAHRSRINYRSDIKEWQSGRSIGVNTFSFNISYDLKGI